jgi:4-amino-4-deoxy-L-arabinose transferase-like glycosyltransferase
MRERDVRRCLAALLALTCLSIAFRNGGSRPLDGHEIFVAESATQMIETGEYIVPEFNGAPRLQKPPLAYWLSAAVHAVLTSDDPIVSEVEARAASLAAAVALVGITFAIARVAFGCPRAALAAAAILASSLGFFDYARSARPEMLYASFCALLMLGLLLALDRAQRGLPTRRAGAVMALGLCGALLSKGPHLPLFFLVAAGLALRLRAPRIAKAKVLAPGWILLGILPAALYFGVVAMRVDGTASTWASELLQDKPFPLLLRPLRFYFPFALAVAMAPWVPLGLLAIVVSWRRRDHAPAAVLWTSVLVSLFFLGFSGKLRGHYVLPLLPLAAALAGWGVVWLWDAARAPGAAGLRARAWLVRVVGVQGVCLLAFLVTIGTLAAGPHPGGTRSMLGPALVWLGPAAALLALAGWILRTRAGTSAGLAVGVALLGWTAIANAGVDASRRWTQARDFAREVARKVAPGHEVLLDEGPRCPLVYYGRLQTTRYRLDGAQASSARDRGETVAVVSRAPRLEALGLSGELLIAPPEDSVEELVLFRPGSRASLPEAKP